VETQTVLAGVTVADSETSLDWYERLLGRAPDQRPTPEHDERTSDRVLFETLIDPEGNKVGLLASRDES